MPVFDDTPLAQENGMLFQQDGAPLHFANIVRDFMSVTFQSQWIGRRGPQCGNRNLPSRLFRLGPHEISRLHRSTKKCSGIVEQDTVLVLVLQGASIIFRVLEVGGQQLVHLLK